MKKNISKILIIMILAVLFVPLFNSITFANSYDPNYSILRTVADDWYTRPEPVDVKSPIYYVESIDENGVIHAGYIATSRDNFKEFEVYKDNYWTKVREVLNDDTKYDFGGVRYLLTEGETARLTTVEKNGSITLTYLMNKEDWLNGNFPIEKPEIISMPVLEYPYYIMYCNEDYTWIRMQTYKEIPIFNIGNYKDYENNTFDITWFGNGPMKSYIYQIPPDSQSEIMEWVQSDVVPEGVQFTDDGQERKIILETNHTLHFGDIHVPPIGEGKDIADQEGNFRLISHKSPITTIHNRIRVITQLNDTYLYNANEAHKYPKTPGSNAHKFKVEYYVQGLPYKEINRLWKGHALSDSDTTTKHIEDVTFDIELPATYEYPKEISIVAVVPETQGTFGIGKQPRKEYRITFEVNRLSPVDEDHDGLDDNTGETGNWNKDWEEYAPLQPGDGAPDRGQYDDSILGEIKFLTDTIIYWITSPFRVIRDGLQYVTEYITDSFEWANNFSLIIARLFSFLPPQIVNMLGMAFITIIIITVVKAVRR
jgi:hypothetical protein